MLFNSFGFLFFFLPITLAGFQLAGRVGRRAVVVWLGLMSLVFYGVWRREFLWLLCGSIVFNFVCSRLIVRWRERERWAHAAMVAGVAGNLLLLFYYKYLFPTLTGLGDLLRLHHTFAGVLLPLGISFFTFTQIGYLIDLRQGAAEPQDLPEYVLFVTFFPHLIAGPILHHSEIMPQFREQRRYGLRADDVAVGWTWFVMGLFKKVMIADTMAPFADAAFAAPYARGLLPAWVGVLSYTLQLYFDFSGYSDMAIGLARMFSIRFPLNFASPYKAASIIDFWARWHKTLTRYETLYLYNPNSLAVNRRRLAEGKSVSRKGSATLEGFASMVAFPTLVSMILIGVWHGAGIQFLLFGLFHGVYLTTNHAWRIFRAKPASQRAKPTSQAPRRRASMNYAASVLLTMLCVIVAQVLFRADSTRGAFAMFASMAGRGGMGLDALGTLQKAMLLIPLLFLVVWTLPNTQQILRRFGSGVSTTLGTAAPRRMLLWRPAVTWGLAIAAAFIVCLAYMEDTSR
ncbi:MAG: alginate O-acetyltransferase complex protein AlgI, partial [Acidobacteriaceae bacterium]|nr:alginate O-acetyltransferase complex protein AlgI [Acidobacteriaceae bacterium]